jgi:hypothetical protein
MKKLLAVFVIMLSIACNKEQIAPPVEEQKPEVFFKDDNVSVVDVKASQTGSRQVKLQFSTEYEKNLQSIEVYSGESMSLLCRIYDAQKTSTSLKTTNYTILENDIISASTHYYMVKYTTTKGEWNCSPLYKVVLK